MFCPAYIYLAGQDGTGSSPCWRIEKRDITSGALVSAFSTDGIVTSDPNDSHEDDLACMAIDGNYIYAVGYRNNSPGGEEWRIEKWDITSGTPAGGFGTNGCINQGWSDSIDERAFSVAIDSTHMFICGSDRVPGNAEWHIERRRLSDGEMK